MSGKDLKLHHWFKVIANCPYLADLKDDKRVAPGGKDAAGCSEFFPFDKT